MNIRPNKLIPGPAAKWDDLRVFLEVARHGSVHAAARHLRLDHSTVCRRIGRLEALLATKLLDRNRELLVMDEQQITALIAAISKSFEDRFSALLGPY